MTRVLVLGTFDLLHPGHLRFLCSTATFGRDLTIAVNTDEFAARFKRAPIMRLEERVEMLEALTDDWPATVVVNDGSDQPGLILETRASVIVHGDDWTGDSYKQQLGVTDEWLAEHGVEIRYVPYTAGISTSEIIARISDAAVTQALESGAYIL